MISPTMTAALIVPVMYGNTGDYSWFSYAVGTVMLLFVAANLNQFAKRSTGSGSMYAYISRGMGPKAGAIGGWALIWAYLGISMAGVTGFTIFAGKLLGMAGINAPPLLLFAVCAGAAWICAWKNVRLSALLMLVLEGLSMTLIVALCFIVLSAHHFAVDTAQFALNKLPLGSLGLGVVVAIFSLVGFECATAFGDEAKDPLRTIPRAVTVSLIISGVFFVFVTYTMVQGVRGYSQPLSALDAPLNTLATIYSVPAFAIPLSLGAMVSFFALCLSCVNAGGRIIYAMGRHGIFHESTASAHATNETPHIAVTVMAALAFLVPTGLTLGKVATLDAFNYVGTMAAFGFMVAYFLVTVAAPVYLKARGELKPPHLVMAAAAILLLCIPAVGTVYPLPPAPVMYFPYIFLAYMLIGVAWILAYYGRKPAASEAVRKDLELAHGQPQSLAQAS
ncbi:MAG TPA: APC family permease [Caulobacteraceae bacterium]|nr:APC family permease [Caulobacteraceae bacterium]